MIFNRWGCAHAQVLSDMKISSGIINCEKNDKIRASSTDRVNKQRGRNEKGMKWFEMWQLLCAVYIDKSDWISFVLKNIRVFIQFSRLKSTQSLKMICETWRYPWIIIAPSICHNNCNCLKAKNPSLAMVFRITHILDDLNPAETVPCFVSKSVFW